MTNQSYQQLIIEGIKGLPPDLLAEITDFVYFVRKRSLTPQQFADERYEVLLSSELAQMKQNELAHLEQEFEAYERKYPQE